VRRVCFAWGVGGGRERLAASVQLFSRRRIMIFGG